MLFIFVIFRQKRLKLFWEHFDVFSEVRSQGMWSLGNRRRVPAPWHRGQYQRGSFGSSMARLPKEPLPKGEGDNTS